MTAPRLLAAILLLVAHSAFAEQWYTLSVDGNRVGYARLDVSQLRNERIYVEQVRIEITQFRRRSTIARNVRVERSAVGEPRKIVVDAHAGVDSGGWQGTFAPDLSRMIIAAVPGRPAVTIELPQGLQLQDQLALALEPLLSGQQTGLRIPMLDVSRAGWSWVRADVDGARIRLVKESGRGMDREDLWFDRAGRLLRREQQFFGSVLTWEPCSEDCDASVEQPFDPMNRLVVRSPYRIAHSATNGPIRYVISRSDGAAPQLVQTSEQAVVRDAQRAIVTICTTCGVAEQATADELARFLAPNAWVQSSDRKVRALARRGGVRGASPTMRMPHLVQSVREHMTGPVDYLGYATAVEALEHRSGDCTEFAVLLAALARAEGIPARIAIGLAYADRFSGKKEVFSPHSWVQVWDGKRWASYDAALDGFDATHIAIAIGDGDPAQFAETFNQLASWKIEKAGLIR
jgi:hypothetical protein